jgi:PhnB protein
MTKLVAYLAFKGNCREAMTFYQQCIGGELDFMSAGDSPMGEQTPPEARNNILHSSLFKDGLTLYASDMFGPGDVNHGNTVSLCIVCSTKEELQAYHSKLSQGAKEPGKIAEEFFGTFAELTDKYGFRWMLQHGGPTANS